MNKQVKWLNSLDENEDIFPNYRAFIESCYRKPSELSKELLLPFIDVQQTTGHLFHCSDFGKACEEMYT